MNQWPLQMTQHNHHSNITPDVHSSADTNHMTTSVPFSLISFITVQLCLVPLLLCVLQISYSSPALLTVSDPWNGFLGNPTGFLLEGCSLGEPIFDKEGFYTPLSLIFPSQRLACVCVCVCVLAQHGFASRHREWQERNELAFIL